MEFSNHVGVAVRRIFAAFAFEEVGLDYRLAGGKGVPAREVIIRPSKGL